MRAIGSVDRRGLVAPRVLPRGTSAATWHCMRLRGGKPERAGARARAQQGQARIGRVARGGVVS